MGTDGDRTDNDELVLALTPTLLGIVLAALVVVLLAMRMRRAR